MNSLLARTTLPLLLLVIVQRGVADQSQEGAFREDFESEPRMTLAQDDGVWRIHACGATDERAFEGKRSFKIDVEWLDPSWDCWRPLPLALVYTDNPTVRAKICVACGSGRLGHPYSTAEQGAAGLLVAGEELRRLDGDWTEWKATADGRAEGEGFLQVALLWVRPDSTGRTTVYVDDVEVEGHFSAGQIDRVSKEVQRRVSRQNAAISEEFAAVENQFAELRRAQAGVSLELPDSSQVAARRCRDALIDFRQSTEATILESLERMRERPTRAELAEIRRNLRLLEKAGSSLGPLGNHAILHPDIPYIVWQVDAVSDERVLPERLPVPGVVADRLHVRGCGGEYEPTSFAVTYFAPDGEEGEVLRTLLVEPTDAKCGERTLPASAIDVRHVKCWWQSGVPIADLTHPSLTPELLLKDPDFVQVDNANRKNLIRDPEAPRDAKALQPVSIPSGTSHQFWVTVHIPDELPAGIYEGSLRVTAGGIRPFLIPITIEVLPFDLVEPALEYSIYYRGVLTDEPHSDLHGTRRTPQRYLFEMENLKAHGITHPTCYEAFGEKLDQAIALRREAGIAVDPFYSLGFRIGSPANEDELQSLASRVRQAKEHLARQGIRELYVYGRDEAAGEELASQREAFQTAREAGAKIFIACYTGAFELVGDVVDHANHSGPPNRDEALKWHSAGQKVFNYGNPQSGVPLPEVYRRNYGLALWKLGYDGVMDWAFCHIVGNAWDDSDHFKYRDICFVYPTADGVVDTLAWEGFREGVDDVRYLSTLLAAIEKARRKGHPSAAEAQEWVLQLDPRQDLDEIRGTMIEWIKRVSD